MLLTYEVRPSCHLAVAGLKYDANWAASLGDDVEAVVYQQADKEAPHYFPHLGHEAAAYIQFMIDYYDCLPNVSRLVCKTSKPPCILTMPLNLDFIAARGFISQSLHTPNSSSCLPKLDRAFLWCARPRRKMSSYTVKHPTCHGQSCWALLPGEVLKYRESVYRAMP